MSTCSWGRVSQGVQAQLLLGPPQLAGQQHRRAGGSALAQQFDGPAQLPGAALGAGVVEGHHEIAARRAPEAPLDHLPGGESIAQADGAEIVHQGGADPGGGQLQGRQSRVDGEGRSVQGGQLQPELQGQSRHAVDAAVPRGDQRHLDSLTGQLERLGAAGPLLCEPTVAAQLVGPAQGLKQIEIEPVAHPHRGRWTEPGGHRR